MNSLKVLGFAFICVIVARVPPDVPLLDLVCDLAAVSLAILSIGLAFRKEKRAKAASAEPVAVDKGKSSSTRPDDECHVSSEKAIDQRRRGACGIVGCPNLRPHSHVADLARRLRER